MANSAQARKRAHQAEARRKQNQVLRSRMRTAIKRVQKAIATGDRDTARGALQTTVPQIDTMVTKGLLSKNAAARYKHRLNNRIKALDA